jgi:hypothetical protein
VDDVTQFQIAEIDFCMSEKIGEYDERRAFNPWMLLSADHFWSHRIWLSTSPFLGGRPSFKVPVATDNERRLNPPPSSTTHPTQLVILLRAHAASSWRSVYWAAFFSLASRAPSRLCDQCTSHPPQLARCLPPARLPSRRCDPAVDAGCTLDNSIVEEFICSGRTPLAGPRSLRILI